MAAGGDPGGRIDGRFSAILAGSFIALIGATVGAIARWRRIRAESRAILDAMGEGVTIADATGRIVVVNQVGQSILGFRPPHETPRYVSSYKQLALRSVDGELLPESEWPINRALRGESFYNYEVQLTRPDGAERRATFSGGAVTGSDGRVVLGVTVYHDVTDLRELERSRAELIGLVSHDLRAPLAIIQGRAEILLRHGGDPAVTRNVRAILKSTRRMDAIIQDLIELPRLASGQMPLKRRAIKLDAFARELVERLLPPGEEERIVVEISPDLPPVSADRYRLERVMTNLLTNALKYSEPGTPVTITARVEGDQVAVSVSDEGQGIAADDLARLFDRYYRAKTGLHIEGIGLGLYITKQIVEAHGGRVWIESVPGEGSAFSFSLPKATEADRPTTALP